MSETSLSLVSRNEAFPLDLDDAKTHLRVDVDDDDELIQGLIQAATEYVETFTHRALMGSQIWDYSLCGFVTDSCGSIWLPKPPVTSITSVSYVDTTGTTQVWASSNYRTELPAGPWARKARITAAYGVTWPSVRSVTGAVTIRFVCGYGTALYVPASIKAAMKILIGHWYEHREAVGVDIGNATAIPLAVDSLLWPYKAF